MTDALLFTIAGMLVLLVAIGTAVWLKLAAILDAVSHDAKTPPALGR